MCDKEFSNYEDFLYHLWNNYLHKHRIPGMSHDWTLDGEDNSVYLATQEVIEATMPELFDYKKPVIIIGV